MADDGKSGWVGGVVALFQQWQVVVTGIAAATALWFGFAEQRRKEVEINREAVAAAKVVPGDAFAADPYATLAEFRVSYPEHAFCAALGTFLAEAARQSATAGVSAQRRMNDAVGAQIDRIAGEGGLGLAAIEALAQTAAGDGTTADTCPELRPPVGLRGRAEMWPDCRVLLETFAQTRCLDLAVDARRASVAAQAMAGAGEAPEGSGGTADWTGDLGPVLPGGGGRAGTSPTDEPAPVASAAPGPPDPACGPTPPTVFIQFSGDRSAAETVRGSLVAAGWTVPAVDAVEGMRPVGDVRYYWPEQAACAAALATSLAGSLGTPFTPISLAGRYRNLPRDRVEVWLPTG